MRFSPAPEQQQLGDMVQRFLAEEYAFEARRRILASPEGFSRDVWARFAELGLLSLQTAEMAPAVVETLLVAQAMGRFMVLEPYGSSAIVATALLRELAPARVDELAAGERIAVLAHYERDWETVATTARREGDRWLLNGRKRLVQHAPAADVILISARTAPDALALFALEKPALKPVRMIDGTCAADVVLDDAPAVLLAERALPAISAALDLGLAYSCAEAVGALQATLDTTIEYTKTRRQFGVPIAKFQALQHRMADMLMHVEQARSMAILAAMRAAEPPSRERTRALAAAKVTVGNACRFVGQQAVQLHGGMGVSDETPVSHLFRKLTALELSFGDTAHHLSRFIAAEAT